MKKASLSLMIFLLSIFSIYSQPAIPNGNFEYWSDANTPDSGWATTNFFPGFYTVSRTTDSYSGTYAIELKTVNTFVWGNLAGVAFTGTLDMQTGQMGGGVPINVKPESFAGAVKYNNVNGDTMAVVVILTKWNGTARDTVGIGGIVTNQSIPNYTPFNEQIQYFLQNVIPDTFQVVLISSAGYSPQENSTLYVDNLSFVGVSGETMPIYSFMQKVYPNPTTGKFNFTPSDNTEYNLKVFNSIGQLIIEENNLYGQHLIDLTNYPKGIYYLNVQNKEKIQTHKVIVQ